MREPVRATGKCMDCHLMAYGFQCGERINQFIAHIKQHHTIRRRQKIRILINCCLVEREWSSIVIDMRADVLGQGAGTEP